LSFHRPDDAITYVPPFVCAAMRWSFVIARRSRIASMNSGESVEVDMMGLSVSG
jgi:hypothetical protein